MRKILLILLVMSLLISTSCQKNSIDPVKTTFESSLEETTVTEETTLSTTESTPQRTIETSTYIEETEIIIKESIGETKTVIIKSIEEIKMIIKESEIIKQDAAETKKVVETFKNVLSDYFVMPDLNTRPVAVMIDNEGYKGYPQGGIGKAQIIYEIIVEWGETRLMAIFFGLDKGNVGPVRSIRHYFIEYAMEYDPILLHIGYSPQAQTMIKKNNLASINGLFGEHAIFFDITTEKNNWQDTYTKLEYMKNHISNLNFRKEPSKEFPFEYKETTVDTGSCKDVYLEYSKGYNVEFEYDDETTLYARKRNGLYHEERYSGKILAAKNIIIQKVETYPILNDKSGRMTMNNVGSGSGYFITNGNYEEIKWEKTSEFSQTLYTYSDNDEKITLNEGQTWIMIMPEDAKILID